MKEQARFMHLRSYMTLRPTLRHRGARRRFRRRMRGRWDRCRRRVSRQAGVIHGDKGGVQGCGVLRGAERFVALAWHWARYMTETVGHVLLNVYPLVVMRCYCDWSTCRYALRLACEVPQEVRVVHPLRGVEYSDRVHVVAPIVA